MSSEQKKFFGDEFEKLEVSDRDDRMGKLRHHLIKVGSDEIIRSALEITASGKGNIPPKIEMEQAIWNGLNRTGELQIIASNPSLDTSNSQD